MNLPEHGTTARHRQGCRCSSCRAAYNAQVQRYRRTRAQREAVTPTTPKRICSVAGCHRRHWAKELCGVHYTRLQRHGTLDDRPRSSTPDLERFMSHVEMTPNGCWLWTAFIDTKGYGKWTYKQPTGENRAVLAHRWLFEQTIGRISAGLTLDHLCRVTACVNPEHMEPVTLAENIRRAHAAKRGAREMREVS